jgi:hypothetical protein
MLLFRTRATVALFVLGVAGSGCADERFDAHFAPEFPRSATSVSIFGVFKDGRLSPESWAQLSGRLSGAFGKKGCDALYIESFSGVAPTLSAAVDDYTRANGVTDDLLAKFAPMAKGENIMLVTVAGHPPQPIGNSGMGPMTRNSQPSSMSGMGGRGARGMASPPHDFEEHTDQSVFQVSATLFSVREHRSVAELAMTYEGSSTDAAIAKFAARLGDELRGSSCTGWSAESRVDEAQIRELMEQR